MTSGFKTVQDRAVRFASDNAEACFTLASELANAKDRTFPTCWRSKVYALQAQELGRLMAEAAQKRGLTPARGRGVKAPRFSCGRANAGAES